MAIEKTLELNLTHEILSLADSFWWYLRPMSLKRYWRPYWRFPLMPGPRSFATGLHINIEGQEGGGYDLCIQSPSNFQGGNPRLLFLQLKAGTERQFCTNQRSRFYGSRNNPNIHIEFGFNNNSHLNQHIMLRELAEAVGNRDAVLYAFPRIVNEDQLRENLGRILTKTSFVSISEIDDKANENDIEIIAGESHNFRTCYNDYNNNEVNYYYYFFGPLNAPGGLIGEILAIRMFRALNELKTTLKEHDPISKYHIMDAMLRHILNIGMYFSIPFNTVIENLRRYGAVSFRIEEQFIYDDLQTYYVVDQQQMNPISRVIFKDILSCFSVYLNWIENIQKFENSSIPNPPKKYTIELESDEARFPFDSSSLFESFSIKDFQDISYTII